MTEEALQKIFTNVFSQDPHPTVCVPLPHRNPINNNESRQEYLYFLVGETNHVF